MYLLKLKIDSIFIDWFNEFSGNPHFHICSDWIL